MGRSRGGDARQAGAFSRSQERDDAWLERHRVAHLCELPAVRACGAEEGGG